MKDLAGDLENLPSVFGGGPTKAAPADLAALTANWASLPENVRQAITALAGACGHEAGGRHASTARWNSPASSQKFIADVG
jgi:hypothetical protein